MKTKKNKKQDKRVHVHSILNSICKEVWDTKDPELCKKVIIDHVSKSSISQKDKDTIINTVRTKTTIRAVWMYFTSSLLYYEKLGVIK